MQERLIDIIIYLLEEFQHPKPKESYKDLSKELKDQGYSEPEINFAFSWVLNIFQNRQQNSKNEFEYLAGSTRVLHEVEKMVIAPDAYGYLLQIRHLNLISDSDMELILDRAMTMGTTSVDLEDIKALAASIIFESENGSGVAGFYYQPGTNAIH